MSSPPELRSYQRDLIARTEAAIEAGCRRVLQVAQMGSGKTVVAAAIIREAVAIGNRVAVLVHRKELLQQASAKLYDVGVDHGIVAAGFPTRPGEPVQVASIMTLHARAVRSSTMALPAADVVIVDEAHHATARTWRRLIEAYPDAVVIGLTATPCRADGRGLGAIFEVMIEGPSVRELIAGGFLVPLEYYAPFRPDLSGVAVRHGDYHERQLAERVDTPKLVGDIVTNWLRLAGRRRSAVFTTSVGHSLHLRNEFTRAGVAAEHLDGSTPAAERDSILARLAAGVTEVVCNCGVLLEGWDLPQLGCVVLARPTKSLPLYWQMIGRGLRPSPGKDHLLVLDHAGAVFEHGFIEDPIEWTLSSDRRASRPSPSSGGNLHASRVLTTCPECDAVRWEGRPCRACDWRFRRCPVAVEVADGDLAQVDRDRKPIAASPTPSAKHAFHRQLAWVASHRGYRPGWVAHKYKEKYGHWPARGSDPEPMEPDDSTVAWIRSRQIAYARARSKQVSTP